MKKVYLKPEMELIEEEMDQQILAGSAPDLGDDYTDVMKTTPCNSCNFTRKS